MNRFREPRRSPQWASAYRTSCSTYCGAAELCRCAHHWLRSLKNTNCTEPRFRTRLPNGALQVEIAKGPGRWYGQFAEALGSMAFSEVRHSKRRPSNSKNHSFG